jgi:hypothetical protein
VGVAGSGPSDYREANGHAQCRCHEHFSATKDIVETCAGACCNPTCQGIDSIKEQDGVGIGDSYVFDEERKVLYSVSVRLRDIHGQTIHMMQCYFPKIDQTKRKQCREQVYNVLTEY